MKILTQEFAKDIIGYSEKNFNKLQALIAHFQNRQNEIKSQELLMFTVTQEHYLLTMQSKVFHESFEQGLTYNGFTMDENGLIIPLDVDTKQTVTVNGCYNGVETDLLTALVSLAVMYSNHLLWVNDSKLLVKIDKEFFNFYYHYLHCLANELIELGKINPRDFFKITD